MRQLVCFFTLLFCLGLAGQEYSFSQAHKISNKVTDFEILGKTKSGVLLHKYGPRYSTMECYDPETLNRLWVKELNLHGKKTQVIQAVAKGSDVWMFYQEKVKNLVTVYGRLFDSKMVAQKEEVILAEYRKEFGSSGFELEIINDESKNYFALIRKIRGSTGYKSVEVLHFNRDFEVLQDLNLGIEDDWRYGESVIVPNGSLLVIQPRLKRSIFSSQPVFEAVQFNLYRPGSPHPTVTVLEQTDFWVKDFAVEYDRLNEKWLIGGYYTTTESTRIDGFFLYSTDSSMSTELTGSQSLFSKKTLQLFSSRYVLGREGSLENVSLLKMIPRSDGGTIIVGESTLVDARGSNPDPFFDTRFQSPVDNSKSTFSMRFLFFP